MKKLMIAAAIVCAAAFANAASVSWSFTETVKKATYPNATDLTTMNAYLFTSSAWDTFLASEKTWDDFKGYSDSHGIANTATLDTQWKYTTDLATKADLASGDYYVVIASEANGYIASDKMAATSYDPLDPTAQHKDAIWAISAMTTGKSVVDSSTLTKFNSVPEPTSGLLLLLGVAGLALRRRRA